MKLDLFATGTLPKDDGDDGRRARPASTEQPFPRRSSRNSGCVHVANGRAMIEDDAGLWVVQRGSVLPDSSRVAGDRGARRQMGAGHQHATSVIELSR